MARKLVLQSIETVAGDRCVDIFRRGDGSYGFEGYRRDPEDGRGWFAIGGFVDRAFETQSAAYAAAARIYPWLLET